MTLKISDMMDQVDAIPVDIRQASYVPAQGIKERALKKIHHAPARMPAIRRIPKLAAAAVLAVVLCFSAAAAVMRWTGFALSGDLSGAEIDKLLNEAATGLSNAYEDSDGMVHYLDDNGNEILVLSPDEAAAYERQLGEKADQAVAASTTRIDAYTMPLMPNRITELAVDENGRFSDCLLGNGSMILLYPAGEMGFSLSAGETVTIELLSNDTCILAFGLFKDGDFVRAETNTAQQHSYTFSIEEDGLYCFSVEYYSAAASSLTDGLLSIR